MFKKTTYILYCCLWAVLLGTFLTLAFVISDLPQSLTDYISLISVLLAFLVQFILTTSLYMIGRKNNLALFLNFKISTISIFYLALSAILFAVFYNVKEVPVWLTITVAVLAFAGFIVIFMLAKMGITQIVQTEEEIEDKINFIESLKNEFALLDIEINSIDSIDSINRGKFKSCLKKVKFSDPVSSQEVSELETEILETFNQLKSDINQQVYTNIGKYSDLIGRDIEKRNRIVKANKK